MGKALTHNPNATNTEALITIAADGDVTHEIESVLFSYDIAPPSPALLTIESPSGTVIHQWWVTAAGPGPVPFSGSCIKGAKGQALLVRLPAIIGGKGIINTVRR
jgi:hypothetical protein